MDLGKVDLLGSGLHAIEKKFLATRNPQLQFLFKNPQTQLRAALIWERISP